jgi:hypothetical protein
VTTTLLSVWADLTETARCPRKKRDARGGQSVKIVYCCMSDPSITYCLKARVLTSNEPGRRNTLGNQGPRALIGQFYVST